MRGKSELWGMSVQRGSKLNRIDELGEQRMKFRVTIL